MDSTVVSTDSDIRSVRDVVERAYTISLYICSAYIASIKPFQSGAICPAHKKDNDKIKTSYALLFKRNGITRVNQWFFHRHQAKDILVVSVKQI